MRLAAGGCLIAALLAAGCGDARARTSAEEIEEGRQLYAANGCGTCHGQSGRGDGPVGKTLHPPPRDFRDAAAFKNGADPTSVANTIATGLTRDGGQMQSYFHLSSRERHLLARYVISLRESAGESRPSLRVEHAWVREPVPGSGMAAAYAMLENPAAEDMQIVSVTADVAATVEVHETVRSGDVMKMSPLKVVPVAARSSVALEPGGLHLMLIGVTRPLEAGDDVTLTFITSRGEKVQTTATVNKAETR